MTSGTYLKCIVKMSKKRTWDKGSVKFDSCVELYSKLIEKIEKLGNSYEVKRLRLNGLKFYIFEVLKWLNISSID